MAVAGVPVPTTLLPVEAGAAMARRSAVLTPEGTGGFGIAGGKGSAAWFMIVATGVHNEDGGAVCAGGVTGSPW